jgi:hypothetical protein
MKRGEFVVPRLISLGLLLSADLGKSEGTLPLIA